MDRGQLNKKTSIYFAYLTNNTIGENGCWNKFLMEKW
jgi:hypothetical protein